MSERLAELLRDAADTPERLPLRDIHSRVRSNRRRRGALAAVGAAALVAAVAVPVITVQHHGHPQRSAALTATRPPAPPTRTRTSALRIATYGNLVATVPPGWRVGEQGCDVPEDRTVTVGPISAADCGANPSDARLSGIALIPGGEPPNEVDPGSVPLTPTTVDGQPAFLQRVTVGAGVQLTESFPFVSAMAVVVAPTEIAARALLATVSVQAATSLQVPGTAAAVEVHIRQVGGAGSPPDARTTVPAEVSAVTAALRSAPLEPVAGAQDCPTTTLVTVQLPGSPAYAVSFGSCDQIVAGNGTLARATPQLRAALAAIVGQRELG